MPRPREGEPTKLGAAVREKRRRPGDRDRSIEEIAEEIGVNLMTLSRVERGQGRPSATTARRLARWLGWSTDDVLDAAETPAEPAPEANNRESL